MVRSSRKAGTLLIFTWEWRRLGAFPQFHVSMKKMIGWSILAGAAASGAAACDLCAVYSAPLAHHVHDAGFHLGISEQFTHFGSVQENGHEVSNESDQYLDSFATQVYVGYQFTDRFGIQFNMPILHRSFR